MFIKEDDLKLNAWQFSQRKYLPWEMKQKLTVTRIKEWYENWDGDVYVSYSGGLDSTVLLHLVRRVLGREIPAVFCNTGLEFPEIVRFARKADGEFVEIVPRDRAGNRTTYHQVLEKYGYPLISKETGDKIYKLRHGKLSERYRNYLLNGDERGKYGKLADKWGFLLHAPFEISSKCCEIMKKRPFHVYAKKTGRVPYIGITQDEGFRRANQYAHTGCNVYDGATIKSQPMAFWTRQDVLRYVVEMDLEICSVYGDIRQRTDGLYYTTGEQRTGCMFCPMGIHLEEEPNRFQRLSATHPKCHAYCMRNTKVIQRATGKSLYPDFMRNQEIEQDLERRLETMDARAFYQEYQVIRGLGMAEVMDYVGIPWTTWEAQGQMSLKELLVAGDEDQQAAA